MQRRDKHFPLNNSINTVEMSVLNSVRTLLLLAIVDSTRLLTREKRYLVFPEGASLSVAICMNWQTGVTKGEIFTEGINWGISYELPNDTREYKELISQSGVFLKRRHRRELYSKLESILSSMGYDGRTCVLRALCEASRHLRTRGDTLVDEILRIVFRYPKANLKKGEFLLDYHEASQVGREHNSEDCSKNYRKCPFSLLDLALGYYSEFGY